MIAWQFLTCIQVNRSCHDPTPRELASSMIWYPLIGLLLGGALVLCDLLLAPVLARSVVDGLLIVLLVALTGGLHQDGLADTLDGLAGGRTPAERLTIMRDPRIGAIGATGVILALGLRYAGLAALPPAGRLAILFCMPALGRWAMVAGSYGASYARPEGGLAQPFLNHLSLTHLLLATLVVTAALVWLLGPWSALVTLAVTALLARAWTAYGQRALGGITGDTLGAANEFIEILFLLAGPTLLLWR
jgi:adenosylcobinamide-GDP ribazoletransferase